jgi:D-serine deaminase-like pyridoxal phosphate-dependent protein
MPSAGSLREVERTESGSRLSELQTPFLTIDLDATERNIEAMQRYCNQHEIALRPHVKTHKMRQLAELQLRAGAVGLTSQKLSEAEVFVGLDCCSDVLISFPVAGTGKPEHFADLAARVRLTVGADSMAVLEPLANALQDRQATAGFLVDCDTGYQRTGVQTPADAAELAERGNQLPQLEFRGLMTHPTQPASGPWLSEAKRRIEQGGLEVACVSGGGTPGAFKTHEISVVTELRVGTYVFGDRRCLDSGTISLSDCALRIRSTVVSTPTATRVILDAGSKTLTSDLGLDAHGLTYGLVVEYPDAEIYALSEEHAHVDVSRCAIRPEVGETVTIIPNHACGAVNLHSEAAVHRGGAEVHLVPVAARGCVR